LQKKKSAKKDKKRKSKDNKWKRDKQSTDTMEVYTDEELYFSVTRTGGTLVSQRTAEGERKDVLNLASELFQFQSWRRRQVE